MVKRKIAKLIPPTNIPQLDIGPEATKQFSDYLGRLIDDGWTDQEIAYDLSRVNGGITHTTGKIYSRSDLIAVIRSLR